MIKKLKLFLAVTLVLCLVLSGCGVGNSQGGDTTEPDSEVIYAPSEGGDDDTTEPTDSDSSQDTADSDAAYTDDTTDTEPVTEPMPDTEPAEGEEDTDDTADDTADEYIEPTVPAETDALIRLGEDFLLCEPISGRIYSTQNEKIRLVLDYNCQMDPSGIVSAYFEIGLECYDINCGERQNGGKLVVNGEENVFSTHSLVHEETEKMFIPFADYTYQFAAELTSCEIDASWFFNGVYAGEEIDTLNVKVVLDWSGDTAPEA